MQSRPPETTFLELTRRYDALLLDAYGVLVHATGTYPGAEAGIEHLNERSVPYCVVTNDASRTSGSATRMYREVGLAINPERVLTAIELLVPYFERHGWKGSSCAVLGPGDAHDCVRKAGGNIVDPREETFEVLVLADDAGYPFRETINAVLTRLIRAFERRDRVELLLPNSDLFYQRDLDAWGFASGSVAKLLESILADRFPDRRPRFEVLGKPQPLMFEEARRRVDRDDIVMIGDQLSTDVRGATQAGLDSALVVDSDADIDARLRDSEVQPDYLLPSLSLKETL